MDSKETWIKDQTCPALYKRISTSGKQSWVLYKSFKGKPIKIKISNCELMDPIEARLEAVKLLRELQAGKNPIARIREERKPEPTIGELFQKYYDDHCAVRNSRPKETKRNFELHWEEIKDLRLSDLQPALIQEWMGKLAKEPGESVANKQFNVLRACLNWSIRLRHIKLLEHPCLGVETFPVIERKEYLQPGTEYARLKAILDSEPGDVADVIWLLLFTAARKSNVLAMRWAEIDWHSKTWNIPAGKTKSKKPLGLPLSMLALEVLQRRRHNQFRSEWVFPAADSALHHRVNVDEAWRKIREKAGIPHLHIHDLRHTMATWMGIAGSSSFSIQRMLGHASSRTTEKYTHAYQLALRRELEQAQLAAVTA